MLFFCCNFYDHIVISLEIIKFTISLIYKIVYFVLVCITVWEHTHIHTHTHTCTGDEWRASARLNVCTVITFMK